MSGFPIIPQQGWQCPVCGRVFSPLTPMCYYCNQQHGTGVIVTTHNTGGPKCLCGTDIPCPLHSGSNKPPLGS